MNLESFQEAYRFYRNQFKKVEKADINKFSDNYRFSSEEKEDLKTYYLELPNQTQRKYQTYFTVYHAQRK